MCSLRAKAHSARSWRYLTLLDGLATGATACSRRPPPGGERGSRREGGGRNTASRCVPRSQSLTPRCRRVEAISIARHSCEVATTFGLNYSEDIRRFVTLVFRIASNGGVWSTRSRQNVVSTDDKPRVREAQAESRHLASRHRHTAPPASGASQAHAKADGAGTSVVGP